MGLHTVMRSDGDNRDNGEYPEENPAVKSCREFVEGVLIDQNSVEEKSEETKVDWVSRHVSNDLDRATNVIGFDFDF